MASIKGYPSFSVYDATKAARALLRPRLDRRPQGPRDIRINVLSPGHTETPGLAVLADENVRNVMMANVPLGRMGTPDDLAKAAVFLASDDSSYITGIELFVDGGVAQF